jgi:hypothetical protein
MKRQASDAHKSFFQKLTDKWEFPDEFATKLVFFGLIWAGLVLLGMFFALAFKAFHYL